VYIRKGVVGDYGNIIDLSTRSQTYNINSAVVSFVERLSSSRRFKMYLKYVPKASIV